MQNVYAMCFQMRVCYMFSNETFDFVFHSLLLFIASGIAIALQAQRHI